jgi:hypothetical protein
VLSREADLDKVRAFVERGLARGDVRLKVARLRDDAPAELAALVESAERGARNRPIRVTPGRPPPP